MAAEEHSEQAIQALLDGRPLPPVGEDRPSDDPLRVVDAIARMFRAAALGSEAASTLPVRAPETGLRRWGPLELVEEIGRGAYGTVYRARDPRLAREVALKLLDGHHPPNYVDEARRLAQVKHPNVVAIHGADRIDDRLGLWMELLSGRTLEAILADQGPFSVRETVSAAVEICAAVAAVHASNLIHRDIKAQNIMREPGGRLVLIDLGTSIDLSSDNVSIGSLAGTPLYMAPELFEGAPATVATDVYAIGVLLYRLVTAEFPIDGHTVGDVRRAHATAALKPLREVRPNLQPAFVALVERCLAPNPGLRFKSVAALERALHKLHSQRSLADPRAVMAIAAASLLMMVAAAGWIAWTAWPRTSGRTDAATPALAMSSDQYDVLAAYQDLEFSRHREDPGAAAEAAKSALALIRPALGGNHPIFGLLYAQSANVQRRIGDLRQAAADALDGATNMLLSTGEDHPYTAVVAMELAANAQAAGHHRLAAEQVLRALSIRRRVLGVGGVDDHPPLDVAALERFSAQVAFDADTDGDGLLDLIELAAGFNPRAADSDGDGTFDDDEQHVGSTLSTRIMLGVRASPFLTWAHYGAHDPRVVGWRSPVQFPMVERGDTGRAGWLISASHGQGYFTQRLSRAQSARAMQAGFSLVARAYPERDLGLVSLVVDTAPVGPRFDLAIRRIDDTKLEVRLLSSVIPREGRAYVVDCPVGSSGPLFELRHRPRLPGAELFIDGRRLDDGYVGHAQFQSPANGGLTWGVGALGGAANNVAASFQLVWLEIR